MLGVSNAPHIAINLLYANAQHVQCMQVIPKWLQVARELSGIISPCRGVHKRPTPGCSHIRWGMVGRSLQERTRLLSVLVVGGGPTGVEFCGELGDFIRSVRFHQWSGPSFQRG